MNKINFMKLAEQAFDVAENAQVSPVDLISELQKEMKEFAECTRDYDDLTEINQDQSFDWLKEEN